MSRGPVVRTIRDFVVKHDLNFIIESYSLFNRLKLKARMWPTWNIERRRLKRLEGIHGDRERCFIIGNGPSITGQDLTLLKDEIVFVNNDFFMHDDYRRIDPTYHCLCNVAFYYENRLDEYRYNLLDEKTKNVIKFLSLPMRDIVRQYGLFADHEIYYLNFAGDRRVWERNEISLDIARQVYLGDTLIIDFCLPLAYYMGFKYVYLLGCECDYKVDEAEDYSAGYFYDTSQVSNENRRSQDYLRKDWQQHIFISYSVAKREFESRGRKIFNATRGGRLDVFERVEYESLIE